MWERERESERVRQMDSSVSAVITHIRQSMYSWESGPVKGCWGKVSEVRIQEMEGKHVEHQKRMWVMRRGEDRWRGEEKRAGRWELGGLITLSDKPLMLPLLRQQHRTGEKVLECGCNRQQIGIMLMWTWRTDCKPSHCKQCEGVCSSFNKSEFVSKEKWPSGLISSCLN